MLRNTGLFGSSAMLALTLLTAPAALCVTPARAQIGIGVSISVPIAPPVLPVYTQPVIPGPGYIWTPGYWAWSGTGYYWVPGTWVLPPRVGVLWTPGYWGWSNGAYVFNAGYWGPTVGFYGGVNYGFGYGGAGFAGGFWNNGAFNYNTAVANVGNTHIGNTYNAPVTINRNTNITNNVSYNGGQGGTTAAPTAAERTYASQQHVAPTAAQVQHQQMASANPELKYANNKGQPAIGATSRPAEFHGPGVTPALGGGPENRNVGTTPQRLGPNGTKPAPQGAGPVAGAPRPQAGPNAGPVQGHPPGPGPGPLAQGPHPGPGPFRAPGPHPGPGPRVQAGPGPHPGPRPGPGAHQGPGPRPGPRPQHS
jgi:hypothetical protein